VANSQQVRSCSDGGGVRACGVVNGGATASGGGGSQQPVCDSIPTNHLAHRGIDGRIGLTGRYAARLLTCAQARSSRFGALVPSKVSRVVVDHRVDTVPRPVFRVWEP
jgi:hypothetical protein